jgi:hypothetical protein
LLDPQLDAKVAAGQAINYLPLAVQRQSGDARLWLPHSILEVVSVQFVSAVLTSKRHFKKFDEWLRESAEKEHSSVRSLVHCQEAFRDERLDADTLALHLGFYLASYGMYRGSVHLLQMSYRIHVPVAEVLKQPHFKKLRDCEPLRQPDLLLELANELGSTYHQHGNFAPSHRGPSGAP